MEAMFRPRFSVSRVLGVSKLNDYESETSAVHLIFDYLTNKKQRTKISCHYSSWKELFSDPQGSILGPMLFSIYLWDLFLLASNINIASYADDTTFYVYGENISSVSESLEKASDLMVQRQSYEG